MTRFEKHVFVCQNERKPDDPRGCCLGKGSDKVLDRLKELTHQHGLKGKVRINKAGCLDQCAMGISIVVYPEGVWYGRVTLADVEEIFEHHILGGKPVERLITAEPGTQNLEPRKEDGRENPEEEKKRAPAKTFEDLIVWQKSRQLALEAYKKTSSFPPSELYGMTSQLRRAAISIPTNIAEAFKKRSKPDKARVLNIAQSSLEESRSLIIVAHDLGYLRSEQILPLLEEVSCLLDSYTRTVLNSSR